MFKALGYHTVAKVFVVLAGYILHFGFGKILTIEEYGIVGTLVTFCNFYYMFLTNGVRQGISKSLAVDRYKSSDVIKKGMTLQTIFSIILAIFNFILAPYFAKAFGNENYSEYIRLISILIPLTAIYFAFVGGLNGSKLFLREAIIISIYPMLRLLAIPIAAVFKGDKPAGVIIGFSLASLMSAIISGIFLLTRKRADREKTENIPMKKMVNVSVEFIIFFAAITIVLNLDTFYLQYVRKDNTLTGLYTGVHTFSLVPYYLISAFYLVILPFIVENYAKGKIEEVKGVISKNFNLIFVFILPITVLISITAPTLLSCFYSPEYYVAGNALRILCFGTFLLSIFAVLNVILNGMNCKKLTRILSCVTVVLDLVLLQVLIPEWGIVGAAVATSVSSVVGCVVSIIYLLHKIGNPFDIKTIIKSICLCTVFGIIAEILFKIINVNNLIVLMLIYIAFAIAYTSCLVIFNLFNIRDILKGKKNEK